MSEKYPTYEELYGDPQNIKLKVPLKVKLHASVHEALQWLHQLPQNLFGVVYRKLSKAKYEQAILEPGIDVKVYSVKKKNVVHAYGKYIFLSENAMYEDTYNAVALHKLSRKVGWLYPVASLFAVYKISYLDTRRFFNYTD